MSRITRIIVIVVALLGFSKRTFAQELFGDENIITTAADGAFSVFAADLDTDGDTDVLSASPSDDKIAWYENTDGRGAFGPQQVITTAAKGARSVFAVDLDGDSDTDVLSASRNDNKIAWYENANGRGAFLPQQVITTATTWAWSVFAADLDGDGDIDVLSASGFDDKIIWYENTDGQGAFGPQQVITTAADFVRSVFGVDLDGDGDIDVLSASFFDGKIAWYENTDGLGTFGLQRVITIATNGAESVFAADLDGDADIDVLSASSGDNKITWYENTDGRGSFGPQQVITTAAIVAESVFAADLDGDGDTDVLSASFFDDKIAWYENTDGRGSFGPQQIITTTANGAQSVFAADLDGDGDTDILSASINDDKIAWYENLSPITAAHRSAAEIFEFALHPNYPNPFNPETEIQFQLPENRHVTLTIFNILGQPIRTLADSKYIAGNYNLKWNGKDSNRNDVSSGVYLYKIQAGSFTQTKKMLLLR